MTTPPPSPEAVEAAFKFLRNEELSDADVRFLSVKAQLWGSDRIKLWAFNAARILAAEVERLRAKEDEGCEWTGFSTHGRIHYRTCRGVLNYTEMPRLQFIPFCPGCGRKVKIQPQTDDK